MGKFTTFIKNIEEKIRKKTHYQLEKIINYEIHLRYLLSILQKFELVSAPIKKFLIQYFRNSLKPSIKTKMNKQGQKLDKQDKFVKKVIDKENKAAC